MPQDFAKGLRLPAVRAITPRRKLLVPAGIV